MKEGMLEAARAGSVLEAALIYLEMGFSVLPVQGKVPAMITPGKPFQWAQFQVKRPAYSYLHNWHSHGWLQGVGIITGAVSGNRIVIDLDGLEAVAEWQRDFNHYKTFTVRSGSGKGLHVYFHVQELPATTRTKGYELRANGCYVVAPPSIHPETHQPYRVEIEADILTVPHLRDVVQWIKEKMPAATRMAREFQQREAVARPDEWSRRALMYWHNAALDRESITVRSAARGQRNNTLFYATRRLARMEGISLTRVREAMLSAAAQLASDEGATSVERTIESAIESAQNMEMINAPAPRARKFNSR